jgi:flavorubredoxin
MAEKIAEGIKSVDKDVAVKLYNAANTDKNDIITEIFKSKAILFGSSTVNKTIMHATSGILEMVKGLGFKNKKAAAFGSYGWSGESVGILEEKIKAAKLDVVQDGLKILWVPDDEGMETCKDFGKSFVEKL